MKVLLCLIIQVALAQIISMLSAEIISQPQVLSNVVNSFSVKEKFLEAPERFSASRGIIISKDEYQKIDNHLGIIFQQLKSHVNETTYDALQFKSHSKETRNELLTLTKSIKSFNLPESLFKKLLFVKKVFHIMKKAQRQLKDFNDFDVPGNRLIYTTIELEVKTLMLNNSEGNLDFNIMKYRSKILDLHYELEFCMKKFRELIYVPHGMREFFKSQLTRVKVQLEGLCDQMV